MFNDANYFFFAAIIGANSAWAHEIKISAFAANPDIFSRIA
jgi:hypothetical protein